MWKRIELHNHTMESDGSMTVKELAAFMEAQGIPWFSLTDHNTVSGFPICPRPAKTGSSTSAATSSRPTTGICSART